MELKKCSNGHLYDPSITPECPECAKLRGKTVPLDEGFGNYGKTVPIDGAEDYGKTEPLHKKTEPVNQGNQVHWAEADKYGNVPFESEDYTPTRPVGYMDGKQDLGNTLPVTGWLVCVEGAAKGQDFKIHAEYNYIGRSSRMDICIQGDSTVSRENHAIIAYDTLDRVFYFAPASGGSIVRVNGRAVLGNVELKAYDRIAIGQSQFIFVPFCGEMFEWE